MPCFLFTSGLEEAGFSNTYFFTAGHIAQRRSHQVCQKASDAYTESKVKMYRYLTGKRTISALILGTI